jgi:hypothetical protein
MSALILILCVLSVGFVLGYGAREMISRQRHRRARQTDQQLF